ncbi:MAG: aminoglycoside phosphotransferase family protein, partial [Chloroflexota bacterium]|nr:aminoglycoside phosphotransferase family protein [Chloroflexota bacterium]
AVPGTSIGEARERVAYEDRVSVARFLGPLVRQLHGLSLEDSRYLPPSWDAFVRFLHQQWSTCVENHAQQKRMPTHLLALLAQIDTYLPPVELLVDRTVAPSLLHCDLNEDHVLGYFEESCWRPAGIIDFGDAMAGDPLYELGALHTGLFHCDKRLLRVFLESYGFDERLQDHFVLRAMSFALLHECDVVGPVFQEFPDALKVDSLAELATLLWDVDQPGLPGSEEAAV